MQTKPTSSLLVDLKVPLNGIKFILKVTEVLVIALKRNRPCFNHKKHFFASEYTESVASYAQRSNKNYACISHNVSGIHIYIYVQ